MIIFTIFNSANLWIVCLSQSLSSEIFMVEVFYLLGWVYSKIFCCLMLFIGNVLMISLGVCCWSVEKLLIVQCATFLKLLIISRHFLVKFLVSLTYNIMAFTNWNNLTPFLINISIISFSCLTDSTSAYSTVLQGSSWQWAALFCS